MQAPQQGYEEQMIVRLNIQAQRVTFLAWDPPPSGGRARIRGQPGPGRSSWTLPAWVSPLRREEEED